MILLLEDNRERLDRSSAVLEKIAPQLEWYSWRSASQMIREVADYLPQARLLSLDHDLELWEGDTEDPGDGVQLVQFLVQWPQPCPVILHSSNRDRTVWMAGELELAGWKYWRVAPLGDDWIEAYWAAVARKLLRKKWSQ
jgi:CheY-like chemotaxis protein